MNDDLFEPALIWCGGAMLEGRAALPDAPSAAVIFASAPSLADDERDAAIVAELFGAGIATIYTPLLTRDELAFDAHTFHFRHDADLLASRYLEIAEWARRNRALEGLPLAAIGTSGAAAGALVAAAQSPDAFKAVVSIDGRTDLAVDSLRGDKVPTLLIVRDMPVLRMNREALAKLRGPRRIEIVHGGIGPVVEKAVMWVTENVVNTRSRSASAPLSPARA